MASQSDFHSVEPSIDPKKISSFPVKIKGRDSELWNSGHADNQLGTQRLSKPENQHGNLFESKRRLDDETPIAKRPCREYRRLIETVWDERFYKTDILKNLLIKEKTRLPLVGRSAYVPYRHRILQWLLRAVEHLTLSTETVQLSIYFLDRYVDRTSSLFLSTKLELHLLVCLKLAAKSIECENNIPSNSYLNNLLQSPYSLDDFISHERKLLEFFQWNVTIPVVNSFLEGMMDSLLDNAQDAIVEMSLIAHKEYFEGVSLKYMSMQSVPPSLVASAIIWASRSLLNVRPFWPESTAKIFIHRTGRDFNDHVHILIKHLQNDNSEKASTLKNSVYSRQKSRDHPRLISSSLNVIEPE